MTPSFCIDSKHHHPESDIWLQIRQIETWFHCCHIVSRNSWCRRIQFQEEFLRKTTIEAWKAADFHRAWRLVPERTVSHWKWFTCCYHLQKNAVISRDINVYKPSWFIKINICILWKFILNMCPLNEVFALQNSWYKY